MLADGMPDNTADEGLIRFWSIEELQLMSASRPGGPPEPPLLEFADYSLWTHGYAVALAGEDPPVSLVGGVKAVRVAPSFSAFLSLYHRKSPDIF